MNKIVMADIPQCSPASFPAELKRGSATKVMVGAIVKGPMNRIKNPMRPEKPTKIWKQDANIIAPCNSLIRTCHNSMKFGEVGSTMLALLVQAGHFQEGKLSMASEGVKNAKVPPCRIGSLTPKIT
uniref:Uncharacterized protein n=1 Tax=Micrurus spixii TaxID=129469 RepID=A0A2D4NEQ6_9SAUR